jgi:hypothetical protein
MEAQSSGAGRPAQLGDYLIIAAAVAVFVYLGLNARVPALNLDVRWVCVLGAVMIATAVSCGWALWKASRFS